MKMSTIYYIMSRLLVLLIILPFIYSCNSPAAAYELPSKKEIAYAKIANSEIKHTKHVKKQQKDICKRLRKIQKRLEKKKIKKG
tara:strand:- start:28 stop:279 length:252 start_codon:yes stop_codon:yes gene_type:complete